MAEEIRERILAEAKRLTYLYGFKRISMDEIAAASKISKKTLYENYKSKEELVSAVIISIVEVNLQKASAILDSNQPVPETFRSFISIFKTISLHISEPMMIDMRSSPEIWNIIDERRRKIIMRFKDIIERGKKEGTVRPDVNTEIFMRILMKIIDSFANPATFLEMNISPGDFIEQLISVFFNGIMTDKKK